MVQPVASAGATLQAIWLIGQFQGVMKPQTPIGSLTMRRRAAVFLELEVLQDLDAGRQVADADRRPGRAAPGWPGAPISSVMALAMSPKRFWYSARMRCSRSMRSSRVVCDQVANALRAALTALSTSAAEPGGDVAGDLFVGRVDHVQGLGRRSGSTHWPSM